MTKRALFRHIMCAKKYIYTVYLQSAITVLLSILILFDLFVDLTL